MSRRRWLWTGGSLLVAGVVAGAGLWVVRPDRIKARIEAAVSAHLHLVTTIRALSIHVRPRGTFEAEGIEIRLPNRPDLPPFIAIDRLVVEANPVRLVAELARGHVGLVLAEGLRITIPPADASAAFAPFSPTGSRTPVVIDRFMAHDALLTILRQGSGHAPLVFEIHALDMHQLGFTKAIPFWADLSNPVPAGDVTSTGTVGPWRSNPSDLPLDGDYTFRHAELDTLPGIGGLLTSEGHYHGTLNELRVAGHTNTPNFNLDLGGRPVPLATTFQAVVNGSNGTTHLESVDARLFHTRVHASGDIVNLPGPAGFDVRLTVTVPQGRIEDVLTLAMDAPQPPLAGDLSLSSTVLVPAGAGPARDRLVLDGHFTLGHVRFADGQVERRLEMLSLRGLGKNADGPTTQVATHVTGRFHLTAHGVTLPDLSFEVPGATVELTGTYALPSQAMAFEGQLRTQASLSSVVGGYTSILIRPFDWLFRRDGAGAVIPIRIEGTRDHPAFGVRLGAALTRGR